MRQPIAPACADACSHARYGCWIGTETLRETTQCCQPTMVASGAPSDLRRGRILQGEESYGGTVAKSRKICYTQWTTTRLQCVRLRVEND
jgi:hypothetical protein